MVAKHKKQHVIPNCYLKAWCDPVVPPGQTAFIWRVPKEGGEPYKRAPEKSFTANDIYTVRMPTGERNLIIENTLAQLENRFVQVRDRIRRRERLGFMDRAILCLFTAAMHARTLRAGEHWRDFQQTVHSQIVAMEQAHGVEAEVSLQSASLLENAHQSFIAMSLEQEAPLYFPMNMTVLVTSDSTGFITSDSPCVWYNPQAHTFPPFYRSPGLAQPDIEVTLPLTPQMLLMFSHHTFGEYTDVNEEVVDRVNHRLRAFADREFVSWKGISRPEWFTETPMPDDAWEFTEEGRPSPPNSLPP